jgi:hypothetical protein
MADVLEITSERRIANSKTGTLRSLFALSDLTAPSPDPMSPAPDWHSVYVSAKVLQNKRFYQRQKPLQRGDEGEHGENEVPATP